MDRGGASGAYPQREIINDAIEHELVKRLLRAYRTLKRKGAYAESGWLSVRPAGRGGRAVGQTVKYEVCVDHIECDVDD